MNTSVLQTLLPVQIRVNNVFFFNCLYDIIYTHHKNPEVLACLTHQQITKQYNTYYFPSPLVDLLALILLSSSPILLFSGFETENNEINHLRWSISLRLKSCYYYPSKINQQRDPKLPLLYNLTKMIASDTPTRTNLSIPTSSPNLLASSIRTLGIVLFKVCLPPLPAASCLPTWRGYSANNGQSFCFPY